MGIKNKKIIIILSCLLLSLFMLFGAGCTNFNGCNKDIFDMTYKYDYAYVNISGTWEKYKIKSWTDYEGEQLQIVLEDGTVILISSINCCLSTR